MAHNIDMTNGRANIAFRGSRNDVWHALGTEMAAGMSTEEWAKAAGLDWHAVKAKALVDLSGAEWDHLSMVNGARELTPSVDDARFIVRSDNGHVLGRVSDKYQPVQPREVLDWFAKYIAVDSHFQLDVAGSLKQGEIIWATATYNGGMNVGGSEHVMRLLMTTTFDGTGSTINKGTATRVVCNNTLDVALSDKDCMVRTRHSTKFNPDRVGQELATIAKGFTQYKAMGDAMADIRFSKDDVRKLFKQLLDIPFDAPSSEVSARKRNQYNDLSRAYATTVAEGTPAETAWCALNAVTRYVDHDRGVRNAANGEMEARFHSAQFGSGAQMKAQAVSLLAPQGMPVGNVFASAGDVSGDDLKAMLSKPLFRA